MSPSRSSCMWVLTTEMPFAPFMPPINTRRQLRSGLSSSCRLRWSVVVVTAPELATIFVPWALSPRTYRTSLTSPGSAEGCEWMNGSEMPPTFISLPPFSCKLRRLRICGRDLSVFFSENKTPASTVWATLVGNRKKARLTQAGLPQQLVILS